MIRPALAAALVAFALPAAAEDGTAKDAAVRYLDDLVGKGDGSGRALTFGGATDAVQLETLPNYEITGEQVKTESAPLAELQKAIGRLDHAARGGLDKALKKAKANGDDLQVVEIDTADAQAITDTTNRESKAVLDRYPVFGKVCRVGKNVYWSPRNPARKLLREAGAKGKYTMELHTFTVKTMEGLGDATREKDWHLKVFRFQGGPVDTGYRILAAADWGQGD